MTAAQVFNWFCKEQKIIPIIREMYYTARPHNQKYCEEGILTEYLSLEEFLNSRFTLHGMSAVFSDICNAYYYTIGWEEYYNFRNRINLDNISKKWAYFVTHNIFVNEDSIKVGDEIEYDTRVWNDNEFVNERQKGEVIDINIINSTVIVKNENNNYITLYGGNLVRSGVKMDFYIKRNRKKYYGANR